MRITKFVPASHATLCLHRRSRRKSPFVDVLLDALEDKGVNIWWIITAWYLQTLVRK